MQSRALSPGHVVVVGAGIVGLLSAWRAQRDGWQVTVIDPGQPGEGTSGGNGAQLSYAHVAPLADPSIWKQLPKLMLSPDSPLRFRLQLDARQWSWLAQFLAACRGSVSRDTTAELLALAAESRSAFDRLMKDERLDGDFEASGKLVLYPDKASFEAARRQLELQARLGGDVQRALTPAQCVSIEPALAQYATRIAGGVYTPGDSAADCLKICRGLHERLRARGVRFELGRRVTGWVQEGRRLRAARTDAGELAADAFVLAAGTASARLGAALGLNLPIYPLKGYSITVPLAADSGLAPHLSVTDVARKVVFARIGQRLRVAGMVELMGHDLRIQPDRIAALQAATRAVLPGLALDGDLAPWCGLRPATPTARPLIGTAAGGPGNLLLNCGHGMLGFTLAAGSAERVITRLREASLSPP